MASATSQLIATVSVVCLRLAVHSVVPNACRLVLLLHPCLRWPLSSLEGSCGLQAQVQQVAATALVLCSTDTGVLIVQCFCCMNPHQTMRSAQLTEVHHMMLSLSCGWRPQLAQLCGT